MLSVETVQLSFATLHIVIALGIAVAARWVPDRLRPYSLFLAVAVALSGGDLLAQWLGVGAVAVNGSELQLTSTISQTVEYTALYGGVAALGGASRRQAATVTVVALFPLYATELLPVLGLSGGALLLVIGIAFLVPLPVIGYLFFRPIWATASQLPPGRRLLHWKARNLILFVYAMVVGYIGLVLAGLIADPVLQSFLLQYTGFVFTASVPTFLVYRFTTDDTSEVPPPFSGVLSVTDG